MKMAEQDVAHQRAISFSITFQFPSQSRPWADIYRWAKKDVTTIHNAKQFRHHWNLIGSGLAFAAAVYVLFIDFPGWPQRWVLPVMLVINGLSLINSHYGLRRSRIVAVTVDDQGIKVMRGQGAAHTIPMEDVELCEISDREADIRYRQNEDLLFFRIRGADFDRESWRRLRSTLKGVIQRPAY